MAVLVYQSYFWMKQGYWKSFGSKLALNEVLPAQFLRWLNNPNSWFGLHKIISPVFNLPLALFLLLFGLVVYLLVAKTFDLFSNLEKMEIVGTRNWRRI